MAKRGKKDGKWVMTCLCITLGVTFSPQLLVASLSPFILKNTRKEAGKLEIKSIANYDAIK